MSLMETYLKRSALLIAMGLLVQVLTVLVTSPLAFIAFLALACPLIVAGVALFLISLVSRTIGKSDAAAS
jgi:hypothetical protein